MADYKKKKVKHISTARKKSATHDNIPMQSTKSRNGSSERGIKVVKGNKIERRRRFRIALGGLAAILAALVVMSFVLPVGIFESLSNMVSTAGIGGYPYEIYGSEIINTVSRQSYYYILTDTNIIARANNGKEIYTQPHGFSRPTIAVSETRALVYEQGGESVDVFSLSKRVNSVKVDGTVITAAISRSGYFAVAYEADTYASSVDVFDKNGKKVYTFNSARDLVTGVTLSPSGKKLAVATLGVVAGKHTAGVSVYGYDSADPLFKKEYNEDLILNIENVSSRGFSVLTNEKYCFVSWRKFETVSRDNELEPAMYRRVPTGALIVYNRSGDRGDNKILILSKKGEKVSEFDFGGIISDITYAHGHIYCISDTTVYMLDKNGMVMRTADCGYGAVRLAVTGTYSVAAVYSGRVERVQLKGE